MNKKDIVKRLRKMLGVGGIEDRYAHEQITKLINDINDSV